MKLEPDSMLKATRFHLELWLNPEPSPLMELNKILLLCPLDIVQKGLEG